MGWLALARAARSAERRSVGEAFTLSPAAGGGPFSSAGTFSSAHARVEVLDGIPVESERPVLFCDPAALGVVPVEGDSVTVRGASYLVRLVRPDGHGGLELELEVA